MKPAIALKLSHKGLLLVGMLLLAELIFVGSLYVMLTEAERAAAQENHAKEVLGITNKIFHQLYIGGEAGADYLAKGEESYYKTYRENVKDLPDMFKELKNALKDSPEDFKFATELERDGMKALTILDFIAGKMRTDGVGQALGLHARYKKVLGKHKDGVINALNHLKEREERFLETTPLTEAKNRQSFKAILVAFVVANVVLAIFLALAFVRGITSRIETLVSNTERIPRGEKLEQRMSGSDEIAHLDHVFHDMADALEAAKEREREIDRMKQEFIAMVSHDLRTPLTAIQGFIQLVADGVYGDLSAEGKDRSVRAERNIDRLMRLINDIIDLNKMESGALVMDKVPCCTDSIVSRSADAVAVVAEKKKIELQVPQAQNFDLYADDDRLVQVLVNLVGNALKFSPEGSIIKIELSEVPSGIRFAVVDQGAGIPDEAQATLFDRFSQVNPKEDRKKGGSGLGLSICKAIIEGHAGVIGVTSKLGQGSSFWFEIPLPETKSSSPDAISQESNLTAAAENRIVNH